MDTKSRLRERMKRRRDAVSEEAREEKSAAIAERLLHMPEYAKNDSFLVYAAIRSEADTRAFCERAWRDGKSLYFPRVTGDEMDFYRTDGWEELAKGSFSVMEPKAGGERYAGVGHVPILVPGVAFSREGARLGYGGGYYDRYLSRHPQLFPIGLCFETQLAVSCGGERIKMQPHDRWMRRIVTEDGVYDTGDREDGYYEC